MQHNMPFPRALLAFFIVPVSILALQGCKKEYITNEYRTVQASSASIVGDTLFIDGDTVLLNTSSSWVMPYQTTGGTLDVKEGPGPFEPTDATVTQGPGPIHPGDRVAVLMQFTLIKYGPCQQPVLVNAGMNLGVDGIDVPGSLTAVDVTGSLSTQEMWMADETTKTFTRVGVFIASSTWDTPTFKPMVRVWNSTGCSADADNYCLYMSFSSTLIGLPQ